MAKLVSTSQEQCAAVALVRDKVALELELVQTLVLEREQTLGAMTVVAE